MSGSGNHGVMVDRGGCADGPGCRVTATEAEVRAAGRCEAPGAMRCGGVDEKGRMRHMGR